MNINKAFTLAEVLITLMIIGVIAAITIPSLKKVSDEMKYVTAAQKAYSTISNATRNIIKKEGPVKTWASGDWRVIRALYKEEISFIPMTSEFETHTVNYLNGSTGNPSYRIELRSTDGMTYYFTGRPECNGKKQAAAKNACIFIEVDTNGKSDPNIIGLDVIGFYVASDGTVYPYGAGQGVETDKESNFYSCIQANGKKGGGWACTAKMITEGKISW